MVSMVLFICSASCGLYSVDSDVKRVHVVLSGLRMRYLFVSMYECPARMIVCLFVCFVGLFHIGNWNFWLVMA